MLFHQFCPLIASLFLRYCVADLYQACAASEYEGCAKDVPSINKYQSDQSMSIFPYRFSQADPEFFKGGGATPQKLQKFRNFGSDIDILSFTSIR